MDPEAAVEVALSMFWERGYDGTPMADIGASLGVSTAEVIATFGNKRTLFQLVAARYWDQRREALDLALAEPSARRVAEVYIDQAMAMATRLGPSQGSDVPRALVTGDGSRYVRDLVAARRLDSWEALRDRLEEAVDAGELTADIDCSARAWQLITMSDAVTGGTTESTSAA